MLNQDETGAAFQAFDNQLHANIIIKELPSGIENDISSPPAMFAGGRAIPTEIKHPALANECGDFFENGRRYLLTETVDGNSADALLSLMKRPFTPGEVLGWADNLLDALHHLHTLSPPAIHGEIKPQNLLVAPDGAIKLIGLWRTPSVDRDERAFGAEAIASPYAPLERLWDKLDSTSQKVILKDYDEKSERILEQPPDERSDLYSLGATLYHLLTARPPVDAMERSIDVLDGKPDPLQPPHAICPAIAPEISDVLMKTLEIRRERRYSSAAIMRQILRTAQARVRERESLETKKRQDAVLEIERAEQKRREEERAAQALPAAESKRLAEEAEEKRQTELIKQQLREAESRRLTAERRAAEAERRLIEIELEKAAQEADQQNTEKPSSKAAVVSNERIADRSVADDSSIGVLSSYAEPQKETKIFRRMAATAVVLVLLGGAIWAISGFIKPSAPVQPIVEQPAALYEPPPAPTAEAVSTPAAAAPAPDAKAVELDAPAPETTQQAADSPSLSDKPSPEGGRTVAPPAARRPKKQLTVARPRPEKKPVTVDDIINDN